MIRKTLAAGVLAAGLLTGAAACGSAQSPLQKCEGAIKAAIDNGAQLTTGAEPTAVRAACGSLSSSDKVKADAYAETYYAQKHAAGAASSLPASAPSSPSPSAAMSTPAVAAVQSPQTSTASCSQLSAEWYAGPAGGEAEIAQFRNAWAAIGEATALATQYAEGQGLYLDTLPGGTADAAPPACSAAARSAWNTAMADLGRAGWLEYHTHTTLTLVSQAVTDASAGFTALTVVVTDIGQ